MLTTEEIDQIKQQLSDATVSQKNSKIENELDDIAFTIVTQHKKNEKWIEIIEWVKDLIKDNKPIIDIRIIIFLTEALLYRYGFKGLHQGLSLTTLFADNWDKVYPSSDDDKKMAFEHMNNFADIIHTQPLTDPQNSPAYSYYKFQLSRRVGYEKDTRDQYGEIIENKKAKRDESMDNGWPSAEEYDDAENRTKSQFYKEMINITNLCLSEIDKLDKKLKTGAEIKKMKTALKDDYLSIANEIIESRKDTEEDETTETPHDNGNDKQITNIDNNLEPIGSESIASESFAMDISSINSTPEVSDVSDPETIETQLWNSIYHGALTEMKKNGVQKTINFLNIKACKSSSNRLKSYYQLIIAKICFNANKVETAKKILVELQNEINEKKLIEWDSPFWISDVLYLRCKCLMTGEPSSVDIKTVRDLFNELCKIDVTKSIVLEEEIRKKGFSIHEDKS